MRSPGRYHKRVFRIVEREPPEFYIRLYASLESKLPISEVLRRMTKHAKRLKEENKGKPFGWGA